MNDNVGSIQYDARIDTSNLRKDANTTERIVQETGSNIERSGNNSFRNFASSASDSFNGVANSILGLAKVAAGVFVTGAFGAGNFVNLAGELQNASQSMGVLIGSTEQANKAFGELYNYTLGKPIAFPTAAQAAKTLAGYGVEADKVVDSMKDLSAISIVTGGDISSLALAYGQVNSRGKLMGQETLQLVNQSVPIVKILAKYFNKSLTQMSEDMQGGTVSAQDFNAALHEYANTLDITKFGDTFKNRMISLQGSIRSVGLAILGVRVDSEKGLVVDQSGLFAKISGGLEEMAKWLKQNKKLIVTVAGVIIDNIVPALGALATGFIAAKAAAIGFAIAANLNPLSLLITGISLVVIGLTFLQIKFDIFGKALGALAEYLKPLIDVFNTYLLPVLKQVGAFIADQLVQAWNDLKGAVASMMQTLEPFLPQLQQLGLVITVAVIAPLVALGAIIIVTITVIARLVGWIAQVSAWFGNLQVSIANAMLAFGSAVVQKISEAITWFQHLYDKVQSIFNGLPSILYGIGSNMIQGLISGITGSVGSLLKTVTGIASKITDTIKGALGIHSPSTVFAGFGMNISEGLAQGINKGAGLAADAVGNLSNDLAINSPLSLSGNDAIQGMSGGSSLTNNIQAIYINNKADADYLLSRLTRETEIYDNGSTPVRKYA